MGRDLVAAAYLCPVQLIVREACLVEAAEQAQNMRVEVELAEIFAVLVHRAGLVPAFGDSRIVLPNVEQFDVLIVLPVDHLKREVLVELWNVAAVADRSGSRLGLTRWVQCVDRLFWELGGELLVLWHGWIIRDRLPDGTLSPIADGPDWS